jgi:hypothetical protein
MAQRHPCVSAGTRGEVQAGLAATATATARDKHRQAEVRTQAHARGAATGTATGKRDPTVGATHVDADA